MPGSRLWYSNLWKSSSFHLAAFKLCVNCERNSSLAERGGTNIWFFSFVIIEGNYVRDTRWWKCRAVVCSAFARVFVWVPLGAWSPSVSHSSPWLSTAPNSHCHSNWTSEESEGQACAKENPSKRKEINLAQTHRHTAWSPQVLFIINYGYLF